MAEILDKLGILEMPDFFDVHDVLNGYDDDPTIPKMDLMIFWTDKVFESHTKHGYMYNDLKRDIETAKVSLKSDVRSSQHYANEYYQACVDWLRKSDSSKYYECEEHHSDYVNAIRLSQMISYIRRNEEKGFVHCGLIFWATYKNYNKVFTS